MFSNLLMLVILILAGFPGIHCNCSDLFASQSPADHTATHAPKEDEAD